MLSTVMPNSFAVLNSSIDFWTAAPAAADQGCQNVMVNPFKSDGFIPREGGGEGVTVAVGLVLISVLVDVGVNSCDSIIPVGVGDG